MTKRNAWLVLAILLAALPTAALLYQFEVANRPYTITEQGLTFKAGNLDGATLTAILNPPSRIESRYVLVQDGYQTMRYELVTFELDPGLQFLSPDLRWLGDFAVHLSQFPGVVLDVARSGLRWFFNLFSMNAGAVDRFAVYGDAQCAGTPNPTALSTDADCWSTTSGGDGNGVPVSGDNLVFNGSSGAGTGTMDSELILGAGTINTTGFTGTFAIAAQQLRVTGTLTHAGGTVTISTGALDVGAATVSAALTATGAAAITMNGLTLSANTFAKGTATLIIEGALTMSGGDLTSTSGDVTVTGNVNISAATSAIDFGSETWTVSGTWTNASTDGTVWEKGTGTVIFDSGTGGTMTFAGTNLSEDEFNNVTFSSLTVVTFQVAASADDIWSEMVGSGFAAMDTILFVGIFTDSVTYGSAYRFTSVTIPQGATVVNANLSLQQFQFAGTSDGSGVKTNVYAHDADTSATITSAADFQGRALTTAFTAWDDFDFTNTTHFFDSPSITAVIQEVVDRAGWASGNALNIIHRDDGSTPAGKMYTPRSFDFAAGTAAKLRVEYTNSSQTFTMATRALRWGGTLTISDDNGGTLLAKATLGLTGGNLTISGAAASALTSTSGGVTVASVNVSTATSYIDLGSELWTVSGTWTNSSTSASWDAGTGTVTFDSATGGTMVFAGANLSEIEFNNMTFASSSGATQTFAMSTRGLQWGNSDVRTLSITSNTILDKGTQTLTGSGISCTVSSGLVSTSGDVSVTFVDNTATGYIDLGSETWTIRASTVVPVWSNPTTSSDWDAGTGTVIFDEGVDTNISPAGTGLNEAEFNNLIFNSTASGVDYTINARGVRLNGTLTMTDTLTTVNLNTGAFPVIAGAITIGANGTLTASSNTITVSGDWDSSSGTFVRSTSTLTLSGTNQTINAGGGAFNIVLMQGSGTKTFSQSFGIGDATVDAGVVFAASGLSMTVDGGSSWTVNGILSWDTVTVNAPGVWTLNSSIAQRVVGVNVENSDASGGESIENCSGTDLGGNVNWQFPGMSGCGAGLGGMAIGPGTPFTILGFTLDGAKPFRCLHLAVFRQIVCQDTSGGHARRDVVRVDWYVNNVKVAETILGGRVWIHTNEPWWFWGSQTVTITMQVVLNSQYRGGPTADQVFEINHWPKAAAAIIIPVLAFVALARGATTVSWPRRAVPRDYRSAAIEVVEEPPGWNSYVLAPRHEFSRFRTQRVRNNGRTLWVVYGLRPTGAAERSRTGTRYVAETQTVRERVG